jgi:hypothetical protein
MMRNKANDREVLSVKFQVRRRKTTACCFKLDTSNLTLLSRNKAKVKAVSSLEFQVSS